MADLRSKAPRFGWAGPPSGRWAALLTPLTPLNSTATLGLIKAIIRHPCLGPCPAKLIRITLHSGHSPAGLEPRLVPDRPPLTPPYNRPSGHWLCVKSCLVWGRDKYHTHIKLIFFELWTRNPFSLNNKRLAQLTPLQIMAITSSFIIINCSFILRCKDSNNTIDWNYCLPLVTDLEYFQIDGDAST